MASNKKNNSKSLVVWNNKGGVGKTTLLFFMSLNFAKKNPHKKILVIDMCPQTDISASFLTREKLKHVINQVVNECHPKSIAGYLSYITIPCRTIDLADWIIKPSDYNNQIPENIRLLCGDNLDYAAIQLNYRINAPPSNETPDPWKFVLESLRKLVDKVKEEDDWVIFIDTNPAFSIYTEIALLAGDLLIIPINADDFSYQGLLNVFKLVYGIDEKYQNSRLINYLREYHFNERVKKRNMVLPKVCSILLVGSNVYGTRAAAAFRTFSKQALKDAFKFYELNTEIFALLPNITDDENDFENNYIDEFTKMNSIGVVSITTGVLPNELKNTVILNDTHLAIKNDQKKLLQDQIDKLTINISRWINPEQPFIGKNSLPDSIPKQPPKQILDKDEEKVLEILLYAFSNNQYNNTKDLCKLTKKSPKYLNKILPKICERSNRVKWQLKEKLQHVKNQSKKKTAMAMLLEKDTDDEDSDVLLDED